MAYAKRVTQIKMILTVKEYNTLIGVLTKNNDELECLEDRDSASMAKEKLLKYGVPHESEINSEEIDIRLYINEAMDIMTQLLLYVEKRTSLIDYYQVLLKVRKNLENC